MYYEVDMDWIQYTSVLEPTSVGPIDSTGSSQRKPSCPADI